MTARRSRINWLAARAVFPLLVVLAAACGGAEQVNEQASGKVSFDTIDADPDWSPDGQRIVFASSRRGGGLYVVRPDGGDPRILVHGLAGNPDWSPDGRQIAFMGRDGIYVVGSNGQRRRLVLQGGRFSLPVWAPDGHHLAVVRENSDFSAAIYVVGLNGRGLRRLLPRYEGAVGEARPGSPAALSEQEPTWSPDGREVAFQAGDGHVVVADLATGHRREIAAPGSYEPAWSPDGNLIAFQCAGQVCVTKADGGGDVELLASDGGDPSWEPDSRRVVFEHYLYGGTNFFSKPQSLSIVDASGGPARKLTFGP